VILKFLPRLDLTMSSNEVRPESLGGFRPS
jgi:hypothetical protein